MAARLRDEIGSFDVVHLHSAFLWPTWAAARAASRARTPYLIAPRGMLVGDMIRRKSRWPKTLWIELIERRTLREAAAVHITAELEGAELRALGLQLPELVCIPNGVEIPRRHSPLSAGPLARLGGQPYALFLSRISWKKGLDRLITAWKWVPDLTLVIAGNDDENYEPALRALARSEGVTDRIQFVGAVGDTDKWALYENALFFVLPSYSENFGNAVVEAMAMSCPVIVSPEVGAASLVRSSGAGLVVDCSPPLLAEAVLDMCADESRRERMGENGSRFVVEQLSWDAIAITTEAAYRRAMQRRSVAS